MGLSCRSGRPSPPDCGIPASRIPADDEWKREPGDGAGRSDSRRVDSRADRTRASGATGTLHWVGRDVDAPAERPWDAGPSRTLRWYRDQRGGACAVAADLVIELAHARCFGGIDCHPDNGGAACPVGAPARLVRGVFSAERLPIDRDAAPHRGRGELGLCPAGDAAPPLDGDVRQPDPAPARYRWNGCHLRYATDLCGPAAVSH